MVDALSLPAPAKLNLFLRVTGRRDDGYHELQTVFQLLDWGDTVHLESAGAGVIERRVDVPGVSPGQDLSLRAARLLHDTAAAEGRAPGGVTVALDKQIPQGSGLGGASTDAASVLLGLNALWDCGFDTDRLAALGRHLGADVPVFVRGHSAWAEGIGDELTPVVLGERWYVLLFPGEGAPTAELFADPALRRDAPRLTPAVDRDLSTLGNDFLSVLLSRSPRVARAYAALARHGQPRLTGSGSTLFLEVRDEDAAERLTSELKIHYNVRAVRGRDRSTALDTLDRLYNELHQ
jgi:4-diphosphocytidyl-2-C-methyl-D-erythritol kinase